MKAVIFDLDGTLSDTIDSIKYCGDRAVAPLGYGPFTEEQYKYFVGEGVCNLIRRMLVTAGDADDKHPEGVHFEEVLKRYKAYFAEDCMYQVKPYDGIAELLAELKRKGFKLCVLSNKPHEETENVIHTLFGENVFDVVQGQTDGIPIKPDPTAALRIAEGLAIPPENIVYLGDTATDMQTGKAAGFFTVGVLWGFRTREELEDNHADVVIAHPMELLSVLG